MQIRSIEKRLEIIERQIKKRKCCSQIKERIANRTIKMGGTDDELKQAIKALQIPQWRLAEAIGMSESVLCKKLRHELDEKTIKNIYKVLDTFVEEQK